MALPARKIVPMIVACALFMQQMDSTALATSLPSMAVSLGVPPLRLHLAITSYLMALAIFLPMSGWVADRFGPRRIFCLAIILFTTGSVLCGVSVNLVTLVCARLLQGLGGAMMVPVGRLILVRSVEKSELLPAMVLMSMTSIVGPAAGPLLGGAITTFISWRWIFWINVPAGILGVILTTIFIKDMSRIEVKPFDWRGFILTGIGFGCLMAGLDSISGTFDEDKTAAALMSAGILTLAVYYVYYRMVSNPILDLRLFRLPTFRVSVTGGSLFRLGFGATPFLLPLLMQEGFGFSPLKSGTITFIASAGSFGMKSISRRILQAYGFRTVLIANALITGAFMLLYGTFDHSTSRLFMMTVIFCGGVFRSLQNTSSNTIAFAEVNDVQMRDATSITQMAQRISQVAGVALSALILGVAGGAGVKIPVHAFSTAFFAVGGISALSFLAFWRLPRNAGDELAGRAGLLPAKKTI
jgi:EmrB/QacA subfamily drug resistance transporter